MFLLRKKREKKIVVLALLWGRYRRSNSVRREVGGGRKIGVLTAVASLAYRKLPRRIVTPRLPRRNEFDAIAVVHRTPGEQSRLG